MHQVRMDRKGDRGRRCLRRSWQSLVPNSSQGVCQSAHNTPRPAGQCLGVYPPSLMALMVATRMETGHVEAASHSGWLAYCCFVVGLVHARIKVVEDCGLVLQPLLDPGASPNGRKRRTWVRRVFQHEEATLSPDQGGDVQEELKQSVVNEDLLLF
eukprot:645412-Amphidinium_carterae.2